MMKPHIVVLALMAAVLSNATPARAQQPSPITRVDLQRRDLSIPGREVVQVRVDIAPGGTAQRHSHPGEEIVYVLSGTLEYEIDGEARVTLNAGGVLFIPYGAIHSARNVGVGTASELATYIVEKGRPLVTPAP